MSLQVTNQGKYSEPPSVSRLKAHWEALSVSPKVPGGKSHSRRPSRELKAPTLAGAIATGGGAAGNSTTLHVRAASSPGLFLGPRGRAGYAATLSGPVPPVPLYPAGNAAATAVDDDDDGWGESVAMLAVKAPGVRSAAVSPALSPASPSSSGGATATATAAAAPASASPGSPARSSSASASSSSSSTLLVSPSGSGANLAAAAAAAAPVVESSNDSKRSSHEKSSSSSSSASFQVIVEPDDSKGAAAAAAEEQQQEEEDRGDEKAEGGGGEEVVVGQGELLQVPGADEAYFAEEEGEEGEEYIPTAEELALEDRAARRMRSLDFWKNALGSRVNVHLFDKRIVTGQLIAVDSAMDRFILAPLQTGVNELPAATLRGSDIVSIDLELPQ